MSTPRWSPVTLLCCVSLSCFVAAFLLPVEISFFGFKILHVFPKVVGACSFLVYLWFWFDLDLRLGTKGKLHQIPCNICFCALFTLLGYSLLYLPLSGRELIHTFSHEETLLSHLVAHNSSATGLKTHALSFIPFVHTGFAFSAEAISHRLVGGDVCTLKDVSAMGSLGTLSLDFNASDLECQGGISTPPITFGAITAKGVTGSVKVYGSLTVHARNFTIASLAYAYLDRQSFECELEGMTISSPSIIFAQADSVLCRSSSLIMAFTDFKLDMLGNFTASSSKLKKILLFNRLKTYFDSPVNDTSGKEKESFMRQLAEASGVPYDELTTPYVVPRTQQVTWLSSSSSPQPTPPSEL